MTNGGQYECVNFFTTKITETGGTVGGGGGSTAKPADYKQIGITTDIKGFSLEVLGAMNTTSVEDLKLKLRKKFAKELGVPLASIKVSFTRAGTARRLAAQTAGDVQVQIQVTVPAAEATALEVRVTTVLPSAEEAAAVILPSVVTVLTEAASTLKAAGLTVPAATSLSIEAVPRTTPPADYTEESYTKKATRRLKKKCLDKKSWCSSVPLNSKGKCGRYCKDGKCTAARKVKKNCKGSCKKKCRAFLASPYAT